MTEIQKEVNKAWVLLSSLHVNGDVVDLMATVRVHLRRAYQLAGNSEEVEEHG